MIFHAFNIDFDANVIIRICDNQIPITILGNMEKVYCNVNIWLKSIFKRSNDVIIYKKNIQYITTLFKSVIIRLPRCNM